MIIGGSTLGRAPISVGAYHGRKFADKSTCQIAHGGIVRILFFGVGVWHINEEVMADHLKQRYSVIREYSMSVVHCWARTLFEIDSRGGGGADKCRKTI